jgi:serine/threonine protein kinase
MDISNFKKENIIKFIGKGSEGTVWLYNDNGNEVALKIFHTDDPTINNENKEEKLILLKDEEYLQDDMKLLNRMYSDGKFIGYTSLYEPYEPISFLMNKKQKIELLKQLQDKYEALNSHNIYIGDFNANNIAFKNNKIKLYDLDNFRVGDLDFNVFNYIMGRYTVKFDNIENIDYYCFNYFGLGLMASTDPKHIICGPGRNNLPLRFKTIKAKRFIKTLDEFNDQSYIERTTDGKQKTLLYLLK